MSKLDQFFESGKKVYEITQQEYIGIKIDHMLKWYEKAGITENIEKRLETDKIEAECFHRDQVTWALKDNIAVPEKVLEDYIGLPEKIKEKQERINSIPLLTQELYSTLQEGNKIIVDGYKVTVHRKEDNKIICRLYKKRKQGIELYLNNRYNIIVGWN